MNSNKDNIKRLSDEFDNTEQKYRALLDTTSAAIVLVSTSWICVDFNDAWCKFLGYSRDELLGMSPREFTHPDDIEESDRKQLKSSQGFAESYRIEKRYIRKNGDVVWGDLSAKVVRNDNDEVVSIIATVVDITERINDQQKILHQAHYDDLTQLPNRFLALDRLGLMISDAKRQAKKIAVMFMDLDDFKKINDMFGHEIGDKLLKESSKRMLSCVREVDTVGRLGGDEFIVILNDIAKGSQVIVAAEKIRKVFSHPFHINNRELLVTISIGIALYPSEGIDVAELLSKSDAAMYHAKQQGRNTYAYYNEAMNKDVKRRLELEEQMVGALERQEFYVVYQPKVNLEKETITGAEALLRWDNEVLGQVTPDEFIPIAEQTGLIVSIGLFVLEETIKVIKDCSIIVSQNFKIAVNISPLQFRSTSFVLDVEQAMLSGGVTWDQLEFEITEGVLASELDHVEETIKKIDKLGVYIAMDDFGTGYSSLSYLRQYPFKILKIDRSFIKEIENNKSDLELVHATIAMAHALNLKVVAEGVETKGQIKLIKKLNCDSAQGYFYSKPIKGSQFLQLLKTEK